MERSLNSRGGVKWPTPCEETNCKLDHDAWHHSGENGMEVYLLMRHAHGDTACCSAAYILFGYYPVNVDLLSEDLLPEGDPARCGEYMASAVFLIGSTRFAPWNPLTGEYFSASKEDLTEEGRTLFDFLARFFGRDPEIVTSLDTWA